MRPNAAQLGVVRVPVAGAFYRIHSTRSLLLPPSHTTQVCKADEASDQIGCLSLASPCSIGFGALTALTNNPGTSAPPINGIEASRATIQNLVRSGTRYPIARKVYLNSLQGFEKLHDSSPLVAGTDAEEELAKCFATLPFNGVLNVESLDSGYVSMPAPLGASLPGPLCEDYDGTATCTDATNTDACLGNQLISGGVIPTSFCNNGLKDGDETAADQCPGVRPSCNPATRHCE